MAVFNVTGTGSVMDPSRMKALMQAVTRDTEQKQTTVATAEPVQTVTSDNMMARNFFDPDKEQSKYIKGMMAGRQAERDIKTRMDSMVAGLKAEIALQGDDITYAERVRIGNKSQGLIKRDKDASEQEAAEEHLEAAKEHLEEKAEEAMTSENAGNATSTNAAETIKTDESASNSSTAESSPQEAAAENRRVSPDAPTVPSLDITV